MFVTLRTLLYFTFNVINSLCMLSCMADVSNRDVCYVWRTLLYV